jgi:xylulokinase
MSPLVMGVDSSTSATKVEVRDADTGALVASGSAPHPATTPPKSEQDPAAWWAAFEDACEQAEVAKHKPAAVSVASQQHGMVVLDADGEVVRPAKLWNDTESAADADWLASKLDGGGAGWATACGSALVAAFTITKLSWLHRKEAEAFDRMRSVLLPHDWLTFRLTGERVTDRGDASGTGYWSPGEGAYRFDLLEIVGADLDWASMVPRVTGPTEAVGEWNGAVVGPGTGDNMAAALGLGLAPGDVAISIGTSGTAFTVSDNPTADPSGAVAGFADASGRYLPLVCTLNATKVTDAIARLLGAGRDEFDALVTSAQAGANGVTLVPYFDGERTPNLPDATGSIAGLRTDVSREDLARAAVEGVVGGLLAGVDALRDASASVDGGRLVIAGGGARSRGYVDVLTQMAGREVTVPPATELVALGACVQAAAVLEQRPVDDVISAWGLRN